MDISFSIHLYKIHLDSIYGNKNKTSFCYKILYSKNNKFYFKSDKSQRKQQCNVNGTYFSETENKILYDYFNSLEFNRVNCSYYTSKEDLQFSDIPKKIVRLLFTQIQLHYIFTMMMVSMDNTTKMKFELNILFLIVDEIQVQCERGMFVIETINFYYDVLVKEYLNLYISYPIKGNLEDCYNQVRNYSKTPLLCYLL